LNPEKRNTSVGHIRLSEANTIELDASDLSFISHMSELEFKEKLN